MNEIAKTLGRPASWVSERLQSLREELALQSGLFFPLTDNEYDSLRQSIADHGVRVPVIVGEHVALVDGRHRLLVSEELGLDSVPAVFLHDLDAETERTLAITLNAARRQLTRQQKRTLVEAELMRDPARSDRMIAGICGVTHPTVAAVRQEIAAHERTENITVLPGITVIEPDPNAEFELTITQAPEGVQFVAPPGTTIIDARPAVMPEKRVTASGRLRTVPQREPKTPNSTSLGYVTCAHGQMHELHRDPDGTYRLTANRD